MEPLLLLALMFVCVGIGAIWKQARAKSCPVHQPAAGRVAMVLAILSMAFGVLLAAFVIATR